MSAQSPVLIVVIPLIFALLTPLFGWWRKGLCYPIAIVALFLSFLVSLNTLHVVITTGTIHYRLGNWAPPWGIEYVVDALNAFVLVVVSLVAMLVGIYSKRSVELELPDKVVYFYTLFLLQVTGFLGIVATGDMFNLYVFIEVASIAAYALIGMGEREAAYASFRYVIIGTVGACWYLLGVGYLYIMTGTLNMANLSELLPPLYQSKAVLTGFVFIFIGVSIKMALFPLHAWLPNAYTLAPSTVSAIVSPLMTKIMAYVIIRVMFTVFKPDYVVAVIPAAAILGWMGAVAVIVGSIYAIAQTDFKKMLSYSVVAQIGTIALGIGLANRFGFTGAILHILNEALTKGCVFAVAGAIVYKMDTCNIDEFKNLYQKMPFTMAAFTMGAFSMVGIPPTSGFFSKLYLILGSIDAGQWVFVGVLLFSSILNAVYFFRVIQMATFETPKPDYSRSKPYEAVAKDEVPLSMLIPILIMAGGIVISGIFSPWIISTLIQAIIPAGF